MAYTFDKLTDAMGDQPQATNIFAPQQGGANAQGGQNGAGGTQQSQGGAVTKTSAEGSLAPATGSGSSQPQAPQVTSQAVEAKNTSRAQAPQAFQQIGQSIQGATKNIQDESNAYVQNAANRDYTGGINKDYLNQAESGDQNAMNQVSSRLNQAQAPQLDQFKLSQDYNIPNLQNIGTAAGVRDILRQAGGAQYSPGEANFDVGLLNRNPNFAAQQQDLIKQANDFQALRNSIGDTTQQQAQAAANTGYGHATQGIKDILTGQQSDLNSQLSQAVAAEQAKNAAAQQGLRGGMVDPAIKAQADAIMQRLVAQNKNANPALVPYLQDPSVFNPNPLAYTHLRGDVTQGQVATPQQLQQFNSIMQLLGGGGAPLQAGSLNPVENFDATGYQNALSSAATKALSAQQGRDAAAAAQAKAQADAAQQAKEQAAIAAAAQQKNAQDAAALAAAAKAKDMTVARDASGDAITPEGAEGNSATPGAHTPGKLNTTFRNIARLIHGDKRPF